MGLALADPMVAMIKTALEQKSDDDQAEAEAEAARQREEAATAVAAMAVASAAPPGKKRFWQRKRVRT